jgi:serine phosphatase RsbU (regulator of sigma subunit)
MPDGRLAIIVADVVGHGIAAAMMMAKVSAEAKYCLASEQHPASAMFKLNDRMTALEIDRFVTVIMLVLDPEKHEVTIVNGGHMAPIWRRISGEISEPGDDLSGLPIGIMEGFDFDQATIQLSPGDVLVMYTDGINEALDRDDKQYTIPRLRDKVAEDHSDLKTLRDNIVTDVRQFMNGAKQEDDMCFVCVKRMS